MLTGRDRITAKRKFKEPFKFINYATMIFCANELPFVYDDSEGFYDRWEIIEFIYKFVNKKEYELADLKQKAYYKIKDAVIIDAISTQEELDGMFNWALEGLNRLFDRGDFCKTTSASQTKHAWMRNTSSFNAFLLDCADFTLDSFVAKETLSFYYRVYCKLHGAEFSSDAVIKQILQKNGITESRKMIKLVNGGKERQRCWVGMKVRDIESVYAGDVDMIRTIKIIKKLVVDDAEDYEAQIIHTEQQIN